MNIRLADINDAENLVRFNQEMATETEGKELDASVLTPGVEAVFNDANKGFYVVCDDGGRIAGSLMVTFEWSDWRNAWFWWIQSVYVLPEYRGKRIYTRLYDFVKAFAGLRKNVCGFRLYVEKENIGAQKVYEKNGMAASHYLMYEEQK
ncbi:MAG TPA: GNAT family N-acetyltransferase [Pyrinomonadaceae bacterium]|nr:GNAT family N-acetyltransferase [Pyrinomonadaceae bacterium]